MSEGGLTGDFYRRITAVRKPVFSIGTLAMVATMIAAILGGSVDTGVLPPVIEGGDVLVIRPDLVLVGTTPSGVLRAEPRPSTRSVIHLRTRMFSPYPGHRNLLSASRRNQFTR